MTNPVNAPKTETRRPQKRRPDVIDGGGPVKGGIVTIEGEQHYLISGCDHIDPFLMSIVSDADHWMFISSSGGLTAGRISPDLALFPYETDDRLHVAQGHTGPLTLIRCRDANGVMHCWEPFAARSPSDHVQRSIAKSLVGNCVTFEEVNGELGLTFRYRWTNSSEFGFIRTSTLERHASAPPLRLEVIDGLLNIVPYGVPLAVSQSSSTLADAYKRSELDAATHLAVYSLEASILDRPEPSECLRASVFWSTGLESFSVMLTEEDVGAFRRGRDLPEPKMRVTGRRGAYLVRSVLVLGGGERRDWDIIGDVAKGQPAVAALRRQILDEPDIRTTLRESVREGTRRLRNSVASADGLQCTEDELVCAHHFSNVLFNNMRGGVFVKDDLVPLEDFASFLRVRNRTVAQRHDRRIAAWRGTVSYASLREEVAGTGDADLIRLCNEYLPLTFSRRHGDPSRPWNQFKIRVRDDHGRRILDYQGNWRDIFQNWEALCQSFPTFLEPVIAKFVNASTVDGFNPYKVSREGIDWEVPEPGNPWSNIGYWGDHQIIYLLRLLEASNRSHPALLVRLLDQEIFSYADVPYRLRDYESIRRNPKNTIEFDRVVALRIAELESRIGSDARLLHDGEGRVWHVNLCEKLLVPALAKLSNFVIEGGIWLNTQRPEWNDANNALVGQGLSVVTLAYLRRYVVFLEHLLAGFTHDEITLSREVADWFDEVAAVLRRRIDLLQDTHVSPKIRREMLDELGQAFGRYRQRVYEGGFSSREQRPIASLRALLDDARRHLDHSLRANRRADGLYHSYNLLHLSEDGTEITIDHLYEMLEGQVAVLSAGVLTPEESSLLIRSLFDSSMYRADQRTFMLYPARELPGFLEKNIIPEGLVEGNVLFEKLLEMQDTSVIVRDVEGRVRFHSDFHSAADLERALESLRRRNGFDRLVDAHRRGALAAFEAVFHHRAFTGRSGTMYKYEGLGSIYWHMVSKLLLATQECAIESLETGDSEATAFELIAAYDRIRNGLGFRKSPREYGAFPTDAYSHTPRHLGAQQPGMTGQVKEGILIRLGELGVRVQGGCIRFEPRLLRPEEFLSHPTTWTWIDSDGEERALDLPANSLAFTYCQTPVVYHLNGEAPKIVVYRPDGTSVDIPGLELDQQLSRELFDRRFTIERLEVRVPASLLVTR